jgi:hypothetical protein
MADSRARQIRVIIFHVLASDDTEQCRLCRIAANVLDWPRNGLTSIHFFDSFLFSPGHFKPGYALLLKH